MSTEAKRTCNIRMTQQETIDEESIWIKWRMTTEVSGRGKDRVSIRGCGKLSLRVWRKRVRDRGDKVKTRHIKKSQNKE